MSSEEQPNIIDNPKLIFDDEDNYIDGDRPNTGGYLMATRRTESVFANITTRGFKNVHTKLYTPIIELWVLPKIKLEKASNIKSLACFYTINIFLFNAWPFL